MATKPNIRDRIKPGQGASIFLEEENPKSNNDNRLESNSNNESNPENNPSNENTSNPNHNPINNPTSNPNYEKTKYTDSRVQRAFYYDKNLIKTFDKEYPKSKYNKSEIMNDLLKKFLQENGKI